MKLFLRRVLYGRRYSKPNDILFNDEREKRQWDDQAKTIRQHLAEIEEAERIFSASVQSYREKTKRLDRLLNYRDPVTCFGKDLFIVWVGSKYSARGIGDKTNNFLYKHIDDVLALVDSDSTLPREKHYPHQNAGTRYTIEYRGGAEIIEGVNNDIRQ